MTTTDQDHVAVWYRSQGADEAQRCAESDLVPPEWWTESAIAWAEEVSYSLKRKGFESQLVVNGRTAS